MVLFSILGLTSLGQKDICTSTCLSSMARTKKHIEIKPSPVALYHSMSIITSRNGL